MATSKPLKCPVCRARFRGTRECSRCGADLTRLMLLVESARRNRERARGAISLCDFHRAHQLAENAERLHHTEMGRRLLLLTAWLEKTGM